MPIELRSLDKDGLSILLILGAANALVWICVLTFPVIVQAQRMAPTQIADINMQSQVDEIEERQIDLRMTVAVLTEKMTAMESTQEQINDKLDTIITGIAALFGTILSGCVVAYFSLRMGWVNAKA